MSNNKTELEMLVSEIRKNSTQVAVNKSDEIKVMQSMINDKDFTLGVYDKNMGYIGQRSPRKEAEKFVKGILVGTTGLDNKDAEHLAEHYEFTKKDASFLVTNMRDYLSVYTSTGRKINIMQNANTEAYIYTKDIGERNKVVPDKENPGKTKQVLTTPYTKLVSSSKCPKYNTGD